MLFVSGLICISNCYFRIVEVSPGEEVTLLCSNFSSRPNHIYWFKLDYNRPNISCIASMKSSDSNAMFFDGFQNGRFKMSSNSSTLSLTIKQVNSSDSGLYFCGPKSGEAPAIASAISLLVQGKIA